MELLLVLLLLTTSEVKDIFEILIPIHTADRSSFETIKLTSIGEFGLLREARTKIPAHYHTGIDVKRPHNNYPNEPVFLIAKGLVISKRDDGPYAQLIIEHKIGGLYFWTVYEHIAEIRVMTGDQVDSRHPIARFMNKVELDTYGWQFDHLHFEILKVKPMALKADPEKPDRLFSSYSLICYSERELDAYYYNPSEFFAEYLGGDSKTRQVLIWTQRHRGSENRLFKSLEEAIDHGEFGNEPLPV